MMQLSTILFFIVFSGLAQANVPSPEKIKAINMNLKIEQEKLYDAFSKKNLKKSTAIKIAKESDKKMLSRLGGIKRVVILNLKGIRILKVITITGTILTTVDIFCSYVYDCKSILKKEKKEKEDGKK